MFRTYSLSSLIALLCLLPFSASFAADIVYAEYGVVGKRAQDENEVFTVEDDRSMFPGEVIKVNYKLKRGEAIYVIWRSPKGDHTLINSSNITPKINQNNSTGWYVLDFEAGKESIIVIVSCSRCKMLEGLFDDLGDKTGKGLAKINKKIKKEISSIMKDSEDALKNMDLSAQAEDTVDGGAVFRGSGSGETVMNKKIYGNISGYSQIFINHKK